MTNQELGIFGENLATNYLVKNGHKIQKRNFRMKQLEVDIISEFQDKVHVTEVKTRQSAEIGEPWRAVTRSKQRQIIKVADYFLKENEIELDTQFDVISIVHNSFRTDLEYIPDAFTPFV